jgi:non-ribosomal peptide synthetase component F
MSKSLALTATAIASTIGSATLPTQIKRVFPPDRSVPQLISHQARENPNHIALGDSSMQLTYGELDDRANQLAHRLKELGVTAKLQWRCACAGHHLLRSHHLA